MKNNDLQTYSVSCKGYDPGKRFLNIKFMNYVRVGHENRYQILS